MVCARCTRDGGVRDHFVRTRPEGGVEEQRKGL